MMTLTLSFYHQDTPLSLHLLYWLLSLQPASNLRFHNLCTTVSLFRNFLQYLQRLSPHLALQPPRFFQMLHLNLLLSFLPGGLAANEAPRFGKLMTGT